MDQATLYPLKFAPQLNGDDPLADYPELYSRQNAPLEFSGEAAFRLLRWEYESHRHLQAGFRKKMRRLITSLNDLLALQGEAADSAGIKQASTLSRMEFAQDFIAFDKLAKLTATAEVPHLPAERLRRAQTVLETLAAAAFAYRERELSIFTSAEIAQAFDLENIFDLATHISTSTHATAEARAQADKDLKAWVKIIAAMRMGELLTTHQYQEDLHDEYFDHFALKHLSQEDLQYLPSIILIEDSRQLWQQASDLLPLWNNNSQVKVLGINRLDSLFALEEEDRTYLDLASLAIMRRNGYVYQGGLDRPSALQQAYAKGLNFLGPVCWNVLLPPSRSEYVHESYLMLIAAAESRYFPRLEYQTEHNYFAAHQLNLRENPSPENAFAIYELRLDGEPTTVGFTIADLLAMHPPLRESLQLLTDADQIEEALPVSEYLTNAINVPKGQYAYLQLVDDEQTIERAKVPANWLIIGQERLAYWRFLQSLAGIQNGQAKGGENRKFEQSDKEITQLKAALEAQYSAARSADLQQTLVQILYRLLGQEGDMKDVLMRMSEVDAVPRSNPIPKREETANQDKEPPPMAEAAPTTSVSKDVWVESEDCTACGDCINALSSVFKYNEDKQAYVHNPQGGSFAQIVAAAEKCPAQCIHPGQPWNESEGEVEKWIKRAEKYN